jgi:hypothetical protein
MRPGNADRLRDLLSDLSDEARTRLDSCIRRIDRGGEDNSDFTAVTSMGYATSDEVASMLQSCGAGRAGLGHVYGWFISHEDAMKRLISASSGDKQEQEKVRSELGVENEEGSDDAAWNVVEETANQAHSSPPQSNASRASSKSKGRGTEDKATSYARDEPLVRAASASKHHVYVKSGGLTFEIDKLRKPEAGRRFTVRVEGAEGKDGKAYDWLNKVVVQLTAEELHQAAAVVLGMSDKMVATHHGDDRDKRLEMRRGEDQILVRVTKTGLAVVVPVNADHLYKVALVFVRALTMNDPDLDSRLLLDTLRLTAAVVRSK